MKGEEEWEQGYEKGAQAEEGDKTGEKEESADKEKYTNRPTRSKCEG